MYIILDESIDDAEKAHAMAACIIGDYKVKALPGNIQTMWNTIFQETGAGTINKNGFLEAPGSKN